MRSPAEFEKAMSNFGIGTGEPVVVYDGFGVYSAPRVWWTFRVRGGFIACADRRRHLATIMLPF
jgi:3-mercaptopyruvate sulfurtransferase SseA